MVKCSEEKARKFRSTKVNLENGIIIEDTALKDNGCLGKLIVIAVVAVEKRDEATLLPIIKRWIKPGSVIVSDWKGYTNLEREGYVHKTVNHSKEFVNKDGFHRNKIEGHWRQAKVKMPVFGVRKYMFSSHLAEFMWRYKHKEDDLFAVFLDDVKKIYPFV